MKTDAERIETMQKIAAAIARNPLRAHRGLARAGRRFLKIGMVAGFAAGTWAGLVVGWVMFR